MKLLGVEKDNDWLYSEWRLTYRVGWEHICKSGVASVTEEFMEADYKEFNLSMCQFMDSVEIAMYG